MLYRIQVFHLPTRYTGRKVLNERALNKKKYDNHRKYPIKDETKQTEIRHT